nr:MAG TPA: hypothetical protein [Caudoviricetes sp.]
MDIRWNSFNRKNFFNKRLVCFYDSKMETR